MIYFAEIDLHSLRFIEIYNYILFSNNEGEQGTTDDVLYTYISTTNNSLIKNDWLNRLGPAL